ncbi:MULTISPECIES: phosphoglucosamine mutase [unclassified Halanaerobium]|uniref:phosphoglucosamine mutase n=1 Tax=unclassified Halanaerobium TaxID=2641197 RepID=UPI000E15ECDE|nr:MULTISPECIES: phosphoglucosamine mutase [unclassified Halanaerobium]RCW49275.1 phosphoglucosamine mutase [Halanaerobium sp. MA284_MarDTE_T2]RCW84014.1 phosphoglucosamine mutase [Halanaerobium sp. DL-01]
MKKLFGTDGVRGVANQELKGDLAYKLGRIGGFFLTENYNKKQRPTVIIGKDTRLSGDMLEAALMAGLTSVGIDVCRLGIIPTPGVCYLTANKDVQGGIMISASHNPTADNGIKFFNERGVKLSDEEEIEIESIFFAGKEKELPYPVDGDIGIVDEKYDWISQYIAYLISSAEKNLKGLKVVIDCANGAAYKTAPEVFRKLGAEISVINNHPDGAAINVNCGSTSPELAVAEVKRINADLGIAYDGDADRVILIDETGEVVPGDNIMAVAALNMMKKNELNKNTVVTTRYSNLGLTETLHKAGGKVVLTKNGDRYVLAEMLKNDYKLGGEKSGHIIFSQYNTTGDGILTAVKIAEIMKEENKSLSDLKSVMYYWPQILDNIKVKKKNKWKDNDRIAEVIAEAELDLGSQGRVFVRASGTEPLVRVMLEGKEENKLAKWSKKIREVIVKELN